MGMGEIVRRDVYSDFFLGGGGLFFLHIVLFSDVEHSTLDDLVRIKRKLIQYKSNYIELLQVLEGYAQGGNSSASVFTCLYQI